MRIRSGRSHAAAMHRTLGGFALAGALLLSIGCSPTASSTPEAAAPAPAAATSPAAASGASASAPTVTTPPKPFTGDAVADLVALMSDDYDAKRPHAAYLAHYFPNECRKHDALPFEQVCEVEDPNDHGPSPMPLLMLGIDGDRIVSALVVGRDPSKEAFSCGALDGLPEIHACVPAAASDADQLAIRDAWTAFMAAAN